MRAKVWKGRMESPLFNCQTYAHSIENLFKLMWDRHAMGEKPDHITELTADHSDHQNGALVEGGEF